MLAILFLAVAGFMMIVLVLLAVVVAGIKQEPPTQELTCRPPSAVTAWVRRLLGVYVRKPDQPPTLPKITESRVLLHVIRPAGQEDRRNEGLPTVTLCSRTSLCDAVNLGDGCKSGRSFCNPKRRRRR